MRASTRELHMRAVLTKINTAHALINLNMRDDTITRNGTVNVLS